MLTKLLGMWWGVGSGVESHQGEEPQLPLSTTEEEGWEVITPFTPSEGEDVLNAEGGSWSMVHLGLSQSSGSCLPSSSPTSSPDVEPERDEGRGETGVESSNLPNSKNLGRRRPLLVPRPRGPPPFLDSLERRGSKRMERWSSKSSITRNNFCQLVDSRIRVSTRRHRMHRNPSRVNNNRRC
ncbi:unnamed protein product [Darwinula stevensoni]|uniref:Uncharacterized protein n=1 Tax=Darwinula stevensoni TaxID=69355 RepID=A0A7R8ZX96_9CRUS|nr:unnamed protein product [Darwinula stevensoni]CAG0878934.1 unnamed protein product [Darwinula stevensoni]